MEQIIETDAVILLIAIKYHSLFLFSETNQTTDADRSVQQAEEIAGLGGDTEDWQALSAKEEEDVEAMMAQCEFAISNAEAFADQLSKDLSVLDGVSAYTVTSHGIVIKLFSNISSFSCFCWFH